MAERPPISGIYEFFFGAGPDTRDDALAYWAELGFTPRSEGRIGAGEAEALYGHRSALTGIRLGHPGCATNETGYVRLLIWDEPASEGLGVARPLDVGSRWMGVYTSDVLTVRDAFLNGAANEGRPWELSPLVAAALDPSAPPAGFFKRWVGLRETFIIGPEFRHAVIQRSGFNRPGFGTFDASTPLPVTEGTHANVVQPTSRFSTEFYRDVFGLQSLGGAHDSGWQNESTRGVLMIEREGQTFTVERLGSPGQTSGFLQVYSPHWNTPDYRERSRPGARGLSCYSYRVADLAGLRERAITGGATGVTPIQANELGEPSFGLTAPDGFAWVLVGGA